MEKEKILGFGTKRSSVLKKGDPLERPESKKRESYSPW